MKSEKSKIKLGFEQKLQALEEINALIHDAMEQIKRGLYHYDRVLASALFTLLVKERANEPLLLNLAKEVEIKLSVTLDNPPPKGVQTLGLTEYLNGIAWFSGVYKERLNNIDVLTHFRHKRSLSHQDPDFTSEMLHSSSLDGWHVRGLPSETAMLFNIAEVVLPISQQFFKEQFEKVRGSEK